MNQIKTPFQIYRELVLSSITYQAVTNPTLSLDTITRRANIYAVQNTWRMYNKQFN